LKAFQAVGNHQEVAKTAGALGGFLAAGGDLQGAVDVMKQGLGSASIIK
jgi:hypothetical protein